MKLDQLLLIERWQIYHGYLHQERWQPTHSHWVDLGVTKHLKGGISTLNPDLYVTIYDVQNNGYRAVNRSTIQSVTCEGIIHE